MSALADQIAEVLRTHVWYFVGNLGVPGMPDQRGYKCYCGWETHANADRPADDPHLHVAERIAELFTEEERSYYDHAEPYGTAYERRFVSPWTAEETKP